MMDDDFTEKGKDIAEIYKAFGGGAEIHEDILYRTELRGDNGNDGMSFYIGDNGHTFLPWFTIANIIDALIEDRGLGRHGIYYYVPALLKHFSTADINALIAPRAHLAIAGNLDKLTPLPGLHKIDRELKKVYEALGAGDKWKLNIYDTEHFETPEMRKDLLDFLKQELG